MTKHPKYFRPFPWRNIFQSNLGEVITHRYPPAYLVLVRVLRLEDLGHLAGQAVLGCHRQTENLVNLVVTRLAQMCVAKQA